MQRFIYTFSWVIIIVGVGLIGYFAYSNLSHDFVYESESVTHEDSLLVYNDQQAAENTSLEVTTSDVATTPDGTTTSATTTTVTTPTTTTTTTVPEKYKDLASRLDKLVTEYGGTMKVGSKGTRVGTVQEFLNIFEGKDQKAGLDNEYGPNTAERVKKFQTSAGLTADGQAGPTTFKAMIEWLEKQS